MLPDEICKRFKNIFPQYENEIIKYSTLGKDTIMIWLKGGVTLIFIYHMNKTWKLISYLSERSARRDSKNFI